MNIKIKHDGKLDLAIGKNRKETSWKNKEMEWSELVKKLSETHRTAETYSEYIASKKDRQDEIKDVGGFVGGYINNGRRKPENVSHRQLITLDIDFAHVNIWDDFSLLFGNAAVLYSTHKHSSDSPRLRLILPLDRPVLSDEYIAISRKIAGTLGIDYFDDTTYQPERLMYWPSTAKDAEYKFEYQDGPWISADDLLNSYHNWQDSSEWPVSSRIDKLLQRNIQKQGDPLEKPGVVGAFCCVYGIAEAITTFLSDVYEPCDIDDRYTYKEGSTSGGLVVYDDKFAYSHHGTDPVSNKLCNAFDLVRIHKFGLKDEDAKEGTPTVKLPSYTDMVGLATKDYKVRKQIGSEKLSEAKGDFSNNIEGEETEAINDDWLAELDVDRKGNYYSTTNNIILILTNDPMIKGCLAMNVFEQREVALRHLPWRKVTAETKYLTDTDDAGIRHYLENTYEITGVQKVQDAVRMVMLKNSFHPVKEYLETLEWDEKERVDTLFIDYLGAEDNVYTRAVTRKILVAAIARIYHPGVKFDYVLTLVGDEGLGKSEIFSRLGRQWFSDSFTTVQGKEAYEQLQGVWIVEMAELAALKKAEIESIKHFVSKKVDRYRVAYGRRTEDFPRQCVFFGSTNKIDFLRGENGNRRFWPVLVKVQDPVYDLFKDLTDEEVGQVWAEAISLYKAKEPLYLSRDLEDMARRKQTEHSEQDDRKGLVEKYLNTLLPDNWDELDTFARRSFLNGDDELQMKGTVKRTRVCIAEIWCELIGGTLKDMTRFNVNDLHSVMRTVEGWKEHNTKIRFKNYGVQRGYIREEKGASNIHSTVKSVADEFLN